MTNSSVLPYDVLDIITQQLVGMGAFATSASVNVASHLAYDATLKTLWTHMYWTAYRDPKNFEKEEVEEKWKTFKASRGAQHIRYMIQPPLYATSPDFKRTPIISSSLSSTLEAAVTIIQHGTFCRIEVYLYDRYRYSLEEMLGLFRTMDVARSLPGFESVSEVDINVHSHLGETATALGGQLDPASDDEQEDEDSNAASSIPSEHFANLPTPPVNGWLQAINLNVDDSVKLDVKDYLILSTHVMVMLRPYAVIRLEKQDDKMGCPEFRMFGLQTDVLLAFTAAYVRFCDSDPLYATFEVTFDLLYSEDDENDVAQVDEDDIVGVLTLLAVTARNLKRAARTVPLKLLGGISRGANQSGSSPV